MLPPTDVSASISLFASESGLHGYTVQTAAGTATMAQRWSDPAAALFAACDAAQRLGENGFAIVLRNSGREWARIDLGCPPHADMIQWRTLDSAAA